MDNKFNTIHIVAEMAIISGMFYYFNKRIKTLESEMTHIKKTYVDTFDDVYKKIELVKTGILQLQTTEQILNSSNSSNSSGFKSSKSSQPSQPSQPSQSYQPSQPFRQANINRNYNIQNNNDSNESITPKISKQTSSTETTINSSNSQIKQFKEERGEKKEKNNDEQLLGSYIQIEVPNIASQLINNVQTAQSDIFDFLQVSSPIQRTSAKVEVIEDDEDIADEKKENVKLDEPENEELNEDDLREIDSILLKDKKDK
jgi:hypothetical protein